MGSFRQVPLMLVSLGEDRGRGSLGPGPAARFTMREARAIVSSVLSFGPEGRE